MLVLNFLANLREIGDRCETHVMRPSRESKDHMRINSPQSSEPPFLLDTSIRLDPLDEQFAVAQPVCVPPLVHGLLFDQPKPNEAEIAAFKGNVPELSTYAVLDAAKIESLPELLESSDLRCRCLFTGEAFDDLQHVGPWIVELEDGHMFLRNLFTKSDKPWHHWEAEAGIFVRSRLPLDTLWAHFRKFTRVQDEQDRWMYWRFWEPKWIAQALQDMSGGQARHFLAHTSRILAITVDGQLTVISKHGL